MAAVRSAGAVAAIALLVMPAVHPCAAQKETDLAKASQNPVADLTSFPLQFNYFSAGGLQSKTFLLVNVQPVLPLPIDKRWMVIARTIVPYTNMPLPDGRRTTGIADIQQQMYFTPRTSGVFTWGAGPILSIPTATNDILRTGQWALGPTVVALATPGRWVVGALANNLWRVGGINQS